MNLQKLVDSMSEQSMKERSNYHATFGDLIDKLKNADDSLKLKPEIVGISAYRGYYSDIALCTESKNINAYKTPYDYEDESVDYNKWSEESSFDVEFTGTPKELAIKLESLIGMYFDGYKGGYNEITRNKPLWIATDYGDCSDLAVLQITDDLNVITKKLD